MGYLLAIETATKTSSVALFKEDKLISFSEILEVQSHASVLSELVVDCLKKAEVSLKKIAGIGVSIGPGSYTGLRIGLSFAKGLCYNLDIPIIEISTLNYLAHNAYQKNSTKDYYYLASMDARRDEIYASFYDSEFNEIFAAQPVVLSKNFLESYSKENIFIIGNGTDKTIEFCQHLRFTQEKEIALSAKNMGIVLFEKFSAKHFADLAYLEPQYLKPFVALKKKPKF